MRSASTPGLTDLMAEDWQGAPRIPMQISRNVVVASVQTDLTDAVLARFREDLLGFIQQHTASGLVVDFSGIDILDATEFAELRKILAMAQLLGARPMVAGLSPGIISSLMDAGADIDGVRGALRVDDALSRLRDEEAELAGNLEKDTSGTGKDGSQDDPTREHDEPPA